MQCRPLLSAADAAPLLSLSNLLLNVLTHGPTTSINLPACLIRRDFLTERKSMPMGVVMTTTIDNLWKSVVVYVCSCTPLHHQRTPAETQLPIAQHPLSPPPPKPLPPTHYPPGEAPVTRPPPGPVCGSMELQHTAAPCLVVQPVHILSENEVTPTTLLQPG